MADDPLLQRIRTEFLEMPGLRLTRRQAERLWAVDQATCARVLDELIEAGFLTRAADGRYFRRPDSADWPTDLRTAKATLGSAPHGIGRFSECPRR